MNKFEKQLISLNSNRKSIVDENIFLNKLHERVEKAERNKETFVTALALVFILFFSTYTQLGVAIVENTFYVEEIESNSFTSLNLCPGVIGFNFLTDITFFY